MTSLSTHVDSLIDPETNTFTNVLEECLRSTCMNGLKKNIRNHFEYNQFVVTLMQLRKCLFVLKIKAGISCIIFHVFLTSPSYFMLSQIYVLPTDFNCHGNQ